LQATQEVFSKSLRIRLDPEWLWK